LPNGTDGTVGRDAHPTLINGMNGPSPFAAILVSPANPDSRSVRRCRRR